MVQQQVADACVATTSLDPPTSESIIPLSRREGVLFNAAFLGIFIFEWLAKCFTYGIRHTLTDPWEHVHLFVTLSMAADQLITVLWETEEVKQRFALTRSTINYAGVRAWTRCRVARAYRTSDSLDGPKIIDARHASSVINFQKKALKSSAGCGMMLCAGGRSGSAPSRGPRNIGVFPCIFESRVLDYLIVDVLSGSLKT